MKMIRSILSLSLLGLILLLMAGAVFLGASAALRTFASFEQVWKNIDALAALEDRASFHLGEMQGQELAYAFANEYETEPGDEPQRAARHLAETSRILDELAAQGHFAAQTATLETFRALLDGHRATFEKVVTDYASGDQASAQTGMELAEEQVAGLQDLLAELVAGVDAGRAEAAQALSQEITLAIQMISAAVVATMLLALLAYRAASRLTEPLFDLTNAVIAAGGDQYRPELTAEVIRQGGQAGRFARALDAFASTIERRHAGEKQEIARLRQELYESRRRRMKIARPGAGETPAET